MHLMVLICATDISFTLSEGSVSRQSKLDTIKCLYEIVCVHLAAELVLHRKVNKADASCDQGIDKTDCVQPRLELGRHHSHEDLPTQGLDTVFTLYPLTYTLYGHDGERKWK